MTKEMGYKPHPLRTTSDTIERIVTQAKARAAAEEAVLQGAPFRESLGLGSPAEVSRTAVGHIAVKFGEGKLHE